MRSGWVVWAGVVGAIVLLVAYNYMWSTDFSYWVSMKVRSVMQLIGL